MTLCQAPLLPRWGFRPSQVRPSPASVSLPARAFDHVAGVVSRGAVGAARRAQSPGCRARDVVSPTQLAEAGPRRRRTIEGASTTSHADIRWLPRLLAAEH